MRKGTCSVATLFALLTVTSPLMAQDLPIEPEPIEPFQDQFEEEGDPASQTAETGIGRVGERQIDLETSDEAPPTGRLPIRLETRIDNRIDNRIDPSYRPLEDNTDATEQADRQSRRTVTPD